MRLIILYLWLLPFIRSQDMSSDISSDISMIDPSSDDPKSSGSESSSDPTGPTGPKQTISSKNQVEFDVTDDKGTKYHFDVSSLTRPNGEGKEDYIKEIQVGPNIQFLYRMNIGADTSETCQNEPSPATESLKIPAGETCRILGRLVDESDPIAANHGTYELIPSLNTDPIKNPSGRDLVITYNNGDLCDPAKQTMRSVSIHLVCDNSLKPEESKFKDVKKEATCNTEYIFESKYACPTGGASHSPKRWLVMGIIGFVLYFLIGAILLKYHYQEEGMSNLIIHKEFWSDVPNLAKEGITFSIETVKSVKDNGLSMPGMPSFGGSSGGDDATSSSSSTSSSPSAYGSGNGTPASDYA